MGQLRRFVLVALSVAGFVAWIALPFHLHTDILYPIVGLGAAIASGWVTWSPGLSRRALGRIALAGWMSFGILDFTVLAWHDLGSAGLGPAVWAFVIVWLVLTGVVGVLVIPDCRPREVYLGVGFAFSGAAPFLGPSPGHSTGSAIGGMWILGLGSLICAWITAAIKNRFARPPGPALPDARVLAKNVE
jgi:hypothetical protein